jgi:hypothetical protein
LRDRPSLQDLLEVQQRFDLPSPALVEKDWYVVKALAAINTADTKPFTLVFSGGTALSRAHRVIRRMSEDIDLKIVSDAPHSRRELRKLRDNITGALLVAGFSSTLTTPLAAIPAMRPNTRFTICPMRRLWPARELCGQRSKSRPQSGRFACPPSTKP